MPESRSNGALKGAIDNILRVARAQRKASSGRRAEADCREIAGIDYDAAVGRQFSRVLLPRMLKEVQKTLPTLNREIYGITEMARLGKIATDLGVILHTRAFAGSEGAAFRGFYVNKAKGLKRPLIWVNTAAHPAAAAAAFWHEVGHHLTGAILGPSRLISLSWGANYREHLEDPKEIAADIVRVLGGYPKPIAIKLFGGPGQDAWKWDADKLVAKAMPHVREVMGLNFRGQSSPKEDLYLLGGLIHTAKLRTTLLTKYGI